MIKYIVFSVFVSFFYISSIYSQPNDSIKKESFFKKIYNYFEKSNEPTDKAFDFSIIGGPHFSSDTKFGLGLVASGLYRVDKSDKSISPSNISMYADFTTLGYYVLGIKSNTIFSKEKYRIDMDLFFSSFPNYRYWGIGYENANNNSYTELRKDEIQIKIDFLSSFIKRTYLGISTTYSNINGKSFDDIDYLNGEKSRVSLLGGGIILSYDSRDFIPNPQKGLYVSFQEICYPATGNSDIFNTIEIIFRNYNKLWNNAVLAFDFTGIFGAGDVPWSMLAKLGGSSQMRGYYPGQFRDRNLLQSQLEVRQKIYKRHGIVVWGGAGNIFPYFDDFEWRQTLPTYGIGYRWEFKKRINIRLDYGIGKGQSAFYFSINESF